MSILNYFFIFFTLSIANQEDLWIPYYENDNFMISYRLERCNDIKNGFDFSFYLIKASNKTNKNLVIDFVLGDPINPRQKEEDKVIVILGKSESKEGKCDKKSNLKLFYSDNMGQKKLTNREFKLSSINFVEIK